MAVIPTQGAPKIKLPYEKEPNAASPYVNTAPDIRTSEAISKGSPVPSKTTQVAAVPGAGVPPAPTPVPGERATATGNTTAAPTSATAPKASPAAAVTSVPTSAPTTPAAATPAAPTVTSPGAPPGVPETKPTTPMVPTPKSIVGKTAAEQEKEQAENEYNRRLYEAALEQTEGNEGAERTAEGSLRGLTGRMGEAGTINSSIFGEGKGLISNARAVAIEKGLDLYNKHVREAQDLWTKAQTAYNRAMEEKRREEAEAAKKAEPQQAGPESPFVGWAAENLGFVPEPGSFIETGPGQYVYVTPQEYAGGVRPQSTPKGTVGHKITIARVR